MSDWKYRVTGEEIIDSESGKALSLEQVAKLLNDVPSVQQQCKDAQDSVNKAWGYRLRKKTAYRRSYQTRYDPIRTN